MPLNKYTSSSINPSISPIAAFTLMVLISSCFIGAEEHAISMKIVIVLKKSFLMFY